MPYEIHDAEGHCLYRGDDLELACEIHDQDSGACLVVLPSPRTVPARPAPRRAYRGPRHCASAA